MISEILVNILLTNFILCFFGGCIYIIIYGIRGYLEEEDGFYLFAIIVGCISVMIVVIIALKAFGL